MTWRLRQHYGNAALQRVNTEFTVVAMVKRILDVYRQVADVQTLMGHKTPEMTQRYAHLSPGTLREAVEPLDAEPAAARR